MKFKHVGIHVFDLDLMVDFYKNIFGLVVSDYSVEDKLQIAFMTASPEDHHQVVLIGGRTPGSISKDILNQLSFKVDSLDAVKSTYERVVAAGSGDIEPVSHGNSWSCYFRDPEGNRAEVYCDTPWYIHQPHFTLIDMTKPVAQIYAETEAQCRADPSFRLRSDWMAETRSKIEAALSV